MDKTKLLPQLIDEETFIREMEHIGSVHKYDKGRRSGAALCGIEKFESSPAQPRGWVFFNHLLNRSIKGPSAYPL